MEPLRLQAVAARVVAWHNHHPLARPITAAHVNSIGYVALPFRSAVAPAAAPGPAQDPSGEGGSLRERAMARSRQGEAEGDLPAAAPPQPAAADLLAAFSENFIEPLKPRKVALWAALHGRTLAEPPTQAPLRKVVEDAAAVASAPHDVTLYVLTALIEVGPHRTRVLVGGGNAPQILGRRLWDWPRLGGLSVAALLLVAVGAAGYGWLSGRWTKADTPAVVPLAASAPEPGPLAADRPASAGLSASDVRVPRVAEVGAVVTNAEHALQPQPVPEHAPEPRSEVAQRPRESLPPDILASSLAERSVPPLRSASSPAALPPVTLTRPPEVAPRQGRIPMPALAQLIPEAAKAEARAARRAREGIGAAPPAAPAGPPAASPPHEPAWAISTRPLRTRTEAEQVMAAMDGLLRPLGTPDVRTEILPEGDDWRVVGWPYTDRREAERALAVLVARGMRVQVVGF
jgi:hypothetical protein